MPVALKNTATPLMINKRVRARQPAGGFGTTRNRGLTPKGQIDLGYLSTIGDEEASNPNRILTTEQLWDIYRKCGEVRAAVDSVARRVATHDWAIAPIEGLDPSTDEYKRAEVAAKVAHRWMRAPNHNGKTFQSVMTEFVTDLLVYDAGVLEVSPKRDAGESGDPNIQIASLIPRRGDDFRVVDDEHGTVLYYNQVVGEGEVRFNLDDILYANLFPNTTHTEGLPLIEAVVSEVVAVIRAAERAMLTFDASELPPGLLVVYGAQGAAAADLVHSFQADRGKDHKIRVVTFPSAQAGSASWVPMQATAKELEMEAVVDRLVRRIWRIFGVQPIVLGETEGMPKATAQVQLNADDSHLLWPILELIEEIFTQRIVPLLIPEDLTGLVEFRYRRKRDLTPEEIQQITETCIASVNAGIITRNEARMKLDMHKVDDDSMDLHTVLLGNTIAKLGDALEPPESPEPPPGFGGDDDGGDGGSDGPNSDEEPDGEDAPGQADGGDDDDRRVHEKIDRELPSEWIDGKTFKGKRTVGLRSLGEDVDRYDRVVNDAFDDMASAVQAAISSGYGDGVIDPGEAAEIGRRIGNHLEEFVTRWQAEAEPLYRHVAERAAKDARRHTGAMVAEAWSVEADMYASQAFGYLKRDDGPIETIRSKMTRILSRVARARHEDVEPGIAESTLLAIVAAEIESVRHRIANWAGKLVELANNVFTGGMEEAREADDPWVVEWVNVGDRRMCDTCTDLGSRGYMSPAQLPTQPGGDTECRARCRCVLVWWKQSETRDGTAELLGGGNTGVPL